MKVRAGTRKVKIPPVGLWEAVVWRMNYLDYLLSRVDWKTMDEMMTKDERGVPAYWMPMDGEVYLHPKPAIGSELILRFYPPMVEI